MKKITSLSHIIPVFPVPDLEKTAGYYQNVLGFTADSAPETSGLRLYREAAELLLVPFDGGPVLTHRALYGSGCDAYFVAEYPQELRDEFLRGGARLVSVPGNLGDFVLEDIDGRWIGFCAKRVPKKSLFACIPEF